MKADSKQPCDFHSHYFIAFSMGGARSRSPQLIFVSLGTPEKPLKSWAIEIEQMIPSARARAAFGPYCVTPEGSLRLPLEMVRREDPLTA